MFPQLMADIATTATDDLRAEFGALLESVTLAFNEECSRLLGIASVSRIGYFWPNFLIRFKNKIWQFNIAVGEVHQPEPRHQAVAGLCSGQNHQHLIQPRTTHSFDISAGGKTQANIVQNTTITRPISYIIAQTQAQFYVVLRIWGLDSNMTGWPCLGKTLSIILKCVSQHLKNYDLVQDEGSGVKV